MASTSPYLSRRLWQSQPLRRGAPLRQMLECCPDPSDPCHTRPGKQERPWVLGLPDSGYVNSLRPGPWRSPVSVHGDAGHSPPSWGRTPKTSTVRCPQQPPRDSGGTKGGGRGKSLSEDPKCFTDERGGRPCVHDRDEQDRLAGAGQGPWGPEERSQTSQEGSGLSPTGFALGGGTRAHWFRCPGASVACSRFRGPSQDGWLLAEHVNPTGAARGI